jgi:HAD superfamily phosphoserine phosphatase-like hydrolase
VVCDLDGTLIRGSSERELLRQLARRGALRPSGAAGFLAGYAFHPLRTLREGPGWNRRYLRGIPAERLQSEADRLVPALLETVRPSVSVFLERMSGRGAKLHLLSASLDPLVERISRKCGFNGFSGSTPEIREGRLTGEILGLRPWGSGKIPAARRAMESAEVSPGETLVIGDSWSDLDLMEFCGAAVAVGPDARLEAEARKRGWEVLE